MCKTNRLKTVLFLVFVHKLLLMWIYKESAILLYQYARIIDLKTVFYKQELLGICKIILFGWISDCGYHFLDLFFSFLIITETDLASKQRKN